MRGGSLMLGPVGTRIVAETFLGLLDADPGSTVRRTRRGGRRWRTASDPSASWTCHGSLGSSSPGVTGYLKSLPKKCPARGPGMRAYFVINGVSSPKRGI